MTRTKLVEVHPPRIGWRVALSILFLLAGYVVATGYNIVAGPMEGQFAAGQLGQGTPEANIASRALAQTDVPRIVWSVAFALTTVLWVWFAVKYFRFTQTKPTAALLILAALSGVVGCGPVKKEQFVEIQDHETAFLVPLEGGTEGQEKFQSKEFLAANLIAAKRVSLPLRTKGTGRMWFDFEWIPTSRVITVSRTPQHREWIAHEQGTGKQTQALRAQSLEGVKFTCGSVISALITEDDAALFRSHFKNVPLQDILDSTVRGFAQEKLAAQFGRLSLDECQKNKAQAYQATEKAVTEEFQKFGITILYFGNHGGFSYINDKVQTSIDSEYLQRLEKQIADKRLKAQATRNETIRELAIAEATAATRLQEAAKALEFVNEIEIQQMQAKARLTMAGKVDGNLPDMILPSNARGENLMLNLGK